MQPIVKNRILKGVQVFVAMVVTSTVVFAHHGTNISYDRTKMTTVKAVVTEYRHSNPHPQLYVDIKDESGKVTNWGCEIAANLYQLTMSGWTKQRSTAALMPGTPVTITIAPSKAGTAAALLLKVVNEKGEELLAAGGAGQ
jgi:hypothetical protein